MVLSRFNSFYLTIFILCLKISLFAQKTDHWETAVFSNDTWKYLIGNSEPNAFWRLAAYDDRDWRLGIGGFGYGDGDDNTIIDSCYAVYLRKSFSIVDTAKISAAILSIDYDDAFVAYINGFEIARSGILGGYPPYNTAGMDHEAKLYTGGQIENFTVSKSLLSKCLIQGLNILSIQVHNATRGSSDLTAIPYLSFGLVDNGTYYRPSPTLLNLPRGESIDASSLPLISITIPVNQTIPTNGKKINAFMRAIHNGPIMKNLLTDSAKAYYGTIGIEIRGASSTGYPQKSYNIETRNDLGESRNVRLLDMPSENDWALISPYNDKTLVRNALTYQLFRSMGYYAPRTQYCEVYLNGAYQGIYILTEKIKRDDERVDITKPDFTATSGDAISGGYIIKNDNRGNDEESFFSNYSEQGMAGSQQVSFIYEEPETEDITAAQKKYLSAYIGAMENALYGNNFTDKTLGYRAYLHVPSFVDYFILGEVSRSVDAYKKSKFYFKDIDSKDGRLYSGPPWDFDWAYKNIPEGNIALQCYYGVTDGSAWAYKSIDCNHSPAFAGWVPRLLKDPYFANSVKTRYVDLRKTILSNSSLNRYIDSVQTTLAEPQIRHYQKWDILGKNSTGSPEVDPQPATFTATGQQLKNWLAIRLNWLDNNMPGTYTPGITPVNHLQEAPIRIFPNPSTDIVFVESDQMLDQVELYTMSGIKVMGQSSMSNTIKLTIEHLTKGLYLLRTKSAHGIVQLHKIAIN